MISSDDTTPTSHPVGQYYLLEKLAQGGMAEIFKGVAYDLHGIKRTVVIKKILPKIAESREFVDMLVSEAKIAVMLSHGNIAQTYDLGKVDNNYFIVMEYVDGQPVSKIHQRCLTNGDRLPIDLIAYIISEVANGLHYMHRKTDEHGRPLHIIHRDVSPQNIMVSYSGTVKIIDFGIAKATPFSDETESGVIKGKFAYMSPEQACGEPIDHRSDIFSLGVILHEMISGRRLFKADNKRQTLANVREARVLAPSEYRDDVSSELDEIVMRALAKSRNRRYMYASELRDDLVKFLHTQFPDFTSDRVAQYITRLFADDRHDPVDDDSKTPILIIDHTQSAIIADILPMESAMAAADQQDDDHVSEVTPLPEIPVDVAKQTSRRSIIRWVQRLSFILTAILGAWALIHSHAFDAWLKQWHTHPIPVTTTPPPPITNEPITTPQPAAMTITTTPPGATIYLNDHDTGYTTPRTLYNVPTDTTIEVGLHHPQYKYWNEPRTFHTGETATLHVDLRIDYGSISIHSSPDGATVLIDGELAGLTPLVRPHLPPETPVVILVQKEGYEPWQNTVTVEPGRETFLNPVLKRVVKTE